MNKKLKKKQVFIKECNQQNDDFWKLYHIFKLTICPGMSFQKFEAYYKSRYLKYIDVTFFYAGLNEIAGFCAAAFYMGANNGKAGTIARSATGFLPQYRGGSLSKWSLYSKYMAYKMHHPFKKLTLTIYAGNPFIYSMVCKYTGIVYPRTGQHIPLRISNLKNNILAASNLQKRELEPFVVKINFEVEKTDEQKKTMMKSNNIHVQFFREKTRGRECATLLLIIPVTFINILLCIYLMTKHAGIAQLVTLKKRLPALLLKCKGLLNLWPAKNAHRKPHYADKKGM